MYLFHSAPSFLKHHNPVKRPPTFSQRCLDFFTRHTHQPRCDGSGASENYIVASPTTHTFQYGTPIASFGILLRAWFPSPHKTAPRSEQSAFTTLPSKALTKLFDWLLPVLFDLICFLENLSRRIPVYIR